MANNFAYEIPGFKMSGINGQDFAGKRYAPIKMNASGLIVECAAKDPAIGFIQEDNKSGQESRIMVNGITMAVAKAPIAAGALVEAAGGNQVQTHTDGKVLGTCVVAATAASAYCSVLINNQLA